MDAIAPSTAEYRDRTEDYLVIESFFSRRRRALGPLATLAAEVAGLTETVSGFIQEHTATVCTACAKVCCINRHSYHETADIIYLCALGERLPAYDKAVADTEPCQFLGERGCAIRRSLRPYRCNWYFCTPLLEHMQSASAREYRRFMGLMTELGRKREALLDIYGEAEKEQSSLLL